MIRHDVCAAYNLYSQHYGWDDYTRGIQARLRRIRYKPSRSEEFLSGLSEGALLIYLDLVLRRDGIAAHQRAIGETLAEREEVTVTD